MPLPTGGVGGPADTPNVNPDARPNWTAPPSVTREQAVRVMHFVEGYLWGAALDDRRQLWDERMMYASQWLRDHVDEIADAIVEADRPDFPPNDGYHAEYDAWRERRGL